MSNIILLDCTLRDGGYVNDWRFGAKNLKSIFERLINSGVDAIEIGFLDDRRPFDIDRSIMPDTSCVNKIWGNLKKNDTMIVGMIDYGTCSINNIEPCENSYLDGIRVIFKKHLMNEAMAFCGEIKKLGYKVFAQLVSITSYNDDDIYRLIRLANEVKPYAVSIVDTYGLMHPEDVLYYYELLDKNINSEIQIGFHAHNNFQMAYANSLAFLEKNSKRDVIVDGTLYGMGKSTGNAPLELLGMRLNEKYNKSYDIDSMLQAIEESIMSFYSTSPWGYKTFFYLCAKNKCHPNYHTYFQKKQNLSVTKIDKLLSEIGPDEKKLLYDKLIAERIYQQFLAEEICKEDTDNIFKTEIQNKDILVIGPGKNIQLQKSKVYDFIKNKKPYIIAINYIPEGFDINCVFVTNSKRYHDMILKLSERDFKILATTNVESINGKFDFIIQRAPLLETEEKIVDNSFLMLIKYCIKLGITEINCAGFDGYSDKEDNYCNPDMEYPFVKTESSYLNYYMKKKIKDFRECTKINFITFSAYDQIADINYASI